MGLDLSAFPPVATFPLPQLNHDHASRVPCKYVDKDYGTIMIGHGIKWRESVDEGLNSRP